jgi:tryptophan 2,3-dioxygenase
MTDRPTTYWDYIRVRELLALQGGLGDDSEKLDQEEVLFITVHQVYELWFKIALRDLIEARNLFQQHHVPDDALAGACRKFERLQIIFSLAVDHFPLVETLTTRDYLEFRDKLFPANGGQSPQFREIEIVLGLDDAQRIPYVTGGSYTDVLKDDRGNATFALDRVEARRRDAPTFKAALDSWLYRTPIHGSSPNDPGDAAVVSQFVEDYLTRHRAALERTAAIARAAIRDPRAHTELEARYSSEHQQSANFLRALDVPDSERPRRSRIRAAILFIEMYRELPLLSWPRAILDKLVALEQTMVHYRQRHARMAERIIGRRVGTGGSSGVEYLDAVALKYRVFEDLWAVRTLLIPRADMPDVTNASFYGFRGSPG